MKVKQITLRCDDYAEACVFTKYYYDNLDVSYEMTFEDSYVGGDYTGFFGRLKRAWKAFTGTPVHYTGVYIDDKNKMKKFLVDCLELIDSNNEETDV